MRRGLTVVLLLTGACAKGPVGFAEPPADGTRVTSPVDRVSCSKLPDTRAAVYASKTYYFCSDDAARRFAESPERFADAAPKTDEARIGSVRTSSTLP
jgi:YHS domain-containing protein